MTDRKEGCFLQIVTVAKFRRGETAEPGLETARGFSEPESGVGGRERDGRRRGRPPTEALSGLRSWPASGRRQEG